MKRKIISMFLIITVLIAFCSFSNGAENAQLDLNQQKEEVDNKLEEANDQLEYIQGELTNTVIEIQKLDDKISNYEYQVESMGKELEELEASIETTTKNLELVTASYEKKEQLLKEQLVVMYELGELSYLDVLLSSTSITEFITTYHLLADLTEYNTKLMDDVEEQMKIIENSKQKLENEQAELKILKSKAEQTSIILKNTKTMQQAYIAKLTDDEKKVNDEIQKYKIEAALIESQIKANSSYGTAEIQNTGGTMPWPVAMTGTQITSYYGTREHPIQGIIKLHQGIDIGNVGYGAPVIAVMDGTVTHAGELGSYGNCVMIDHGNGITTVYAHGQSVLTEKGATVKKGDVILATGSTGNSTGPHLHFEVRVNGNTVDPLLFVNEPK